MPIAVKDFTWEETQSMLYITVPLKGVHPQKVDILSTECYIKVHYSPFFFECFLKGEVFDQKSAVQVGNGAIVFKLEKQENRVWEQLQCPAAGNKKEEMLLREAAQLRLRERSEQEQTQKADLKREHNRYGVKQQMRIEDDDHKRIANAKESERLKATEELEKWKQQQTHMALMMREKEEKDRTERDAQALVRKKKDASEIFEEAAGNNQMRDPGKISVSFTPRIFPTAARESQAANEEEWLQKQAERRRVIELDNADLSEEERNPVWLRDKGNAFFQAENFESALNVFSHAIRMEAKMPALFSNRAACHLKMGNMFKCIDDCSKALDLLTPPVDQNAASRVKAHVRRGTAFCKLELYAEGLLDYEAALKVDPKNERLREDADKIRHIIQTSSTYCN